MSAQWEHAAGCPECGARKGHRVMCPQLEELLHPKMTADDLGLSYCAKHDNLYATVCRACEP